MKTIHFKISHYILLLFCAGMMMALSFCSDPASGKPKTNKTTILIQPLGKFDVGELDLLAQSIKQSIPNVKIAPAIELPTEAYYRERNRYRADLLIKNLRKRAEANSIVLGVTNSDISTTLRNHKDWGVMGLAFNPGNSCVVSSFRLSPKNKSEQLFKVAIHELGHTQGLPHCDVDTCFMRDAGGRNITDQLVGFCSSCSSYLQKRGWTLK